ncbi:hypothetical protein B0T24DRAFT_680086 [Lasiosphaeria ovina]|uniref:Galactose oxidase n=1 Tax=Lasiosphaeria ovina TaxID=92902 RepID=A0AAE0K783_9PEZI|nr:hypothetical protein B0T24DRAFT_680086 [Lasiosphaeria ovina]
MAELRSRKQAATTLSSTQLVIIDGVLQTGAVLDSVYLYDIPKNAWKKLAPLPVAINHANAAAVDGKIYVLGGMTGASWAGWVTARARMPAPRSGFATGIIGTKIYTFGSEGNPDPGVQGRLRLRTAFTRFQKNLACGRLLLYGEQVHLTLDP